MYTIIVILCTYVQNLHFLQVLNVKSSVELTHFKRQFGITYEIEVKYFHKQVVNSHDT